MLDAARDDMIAVEPAAEELLKELGDEHAYLSCTLLAQLMSERRELYHFHDMLKLEAEPRRLFDRPGSDFVGRKSVVEGKSGSGWGACGGARPLNTKTLANMLAALTQI